MLDAHSDLAIPPETGFLAADPVLDVSFSASRLIDEHGGDIGLVQSPREGSMKDADFLCRNPVGNGSAPVLRRSSRQQVRALDRHIDGRFCCWRGCF